MTSANIRIAHRYAGDEGIDDIKRAQALATELRAHGRDVIALHIGQPAFRPPATVFEAYARILATHPNEYSPMSGLAKTRALLRDHAATWLAHITSSEQVAYQDSGCHALDNLCTILCDPGDELILPDPMWAVYATCARNAAAVPISIPYLTGDDIDTERIRAAITPRTRAIVVNSPENPTGRMLRPAHLEALARIAQAHGLTVIEDGVYRDLTYTGAQASIATLIPERTVVVDSFSKKCASTGARLGAIYAPPHVIRAVERTDRGAIGAPSTIGQYFLWALFETGNVPLPGMREELHARRDATLLELDVMRNRYGWTHAPLDGAFYAFPDVRAEARGFAQDLLRATGVSVVPGTGFGASGATSVRISYGSADVKTIRDAFTRIRAFLDGPATTC